MAKWWKQQFSSLGIAWSNPIDGLFNVEILILFFHLRFYFYFFISLFIFLFLFPFPFPFRCHLLLIVIVTVTIAITVTITMTLLFTIIIQFIWRFFIQWSDENVPDCLSFNCSLVLWLIDLLIHWLINLLIYWLADVFTSINTECPENPCPNL
jgi:hypothetical protein